MNKRELFLFDPSLWAAITPEEVSATLADMRALDIAHFPFEKVDVQFYCTLAHDGTIGVNIAHTRTCMTIRYEGLTEHGTCDRVMLDTLPPEYRPSSHDGRDAPKAFARTLADVLIVLLATRNVVKTSKENKLARLGIGKHSRYARVTTISCPARERLDNDGTSAPGKPRAPHLRRGHIRRQRYGQALTLVKSIWVEPCFVNADANFVSTREKYKLR
jgi:hypothetical protein